MFGIYAKIVIVKIEVNTAGFLPIAKATQYVRCNDLRRGGGGGGGETKRKKVPRQKLH